MKIKIHKKEKWLEHHRVIWAGFGSRTDRVGVSASIFLYTEQVTKGWNGAWVQTISRQDV